MNIERRIEAMPPTARWALHRLVTLVLPTAGLCAMVSIAGCSKTNEPEIPSVFEVTGRTTISGQVVVTARDTGTGCEVIITPEGIMARNERSADGLSVKQRCVLTGTEQSGQAGPPPVTTTVLPADPGQTSPPDSQPAAVADAVREATAPAPSGRTIPPPSGKGTRPRAVPATPTRDAPTTDGVESQLKN